MMACLSLALCAAAAGAQAPEPVLAVVSSIIVARDVEPSESAPGHPRLLLRLTLAVMRHAGWRLDDVARMARQAAGILGQCGLRVAPIELHEVDGPRRYRFLSSPVSRELVKALGLPKPTVFFVEGTLQRPAFDAEAVGRGNSRSRPEMADTVWVAFGARDVGVVVAHELAHVLSDSGEHSDAPDNLMSEETSPSAVRLTPAQCERIRTNALQNGLLSVPR